jgi:hypothetical protein
VSRYGVLIGKYASKKKDASACLPIPAQVCPLRHRFYLPCRPPGDEYRVYARLETSKLVELSEVLELGLTPKENTGHVAPKDKSREIRTLPSAAAHSPLSNGTTPAPAASRTAARHRYTAAAVATQDRRGSAAAGRALLR